MIKPGSTYTDYEPHDKDNNNHWSGWHLTLGLTQIQISTGLFSVTEEQLAESYRDKTLASTQWAPVQLPLKHALTLLAARVEVTDCSCIYLSILCSHEHSMRDHEGVFR